ncbi:MAG: RsmF rRNA methyltransferase first C-terminal domain-containing protein, partial [Anaerolineales bacterium]|nr:RsmF rRNA methyltransferase first C-terminal domain-containing protein [Anaerolineales bacterium]
VDGAEPARPFWTTPEQQANMDIGSLRHAVRLWPHKFVGEGHFIAVMQRTDAGEVVEPRPWRWQPPYSSELKPWREFARAVLRDDFAEEHMVLVNGRLYLLPERTLDVTGIKLVRYGLLLGEIRRGIFKPAHTLALALQAGEVTATVDWPADHQEIVRYLTGHELRLPGPSGWVLVTVDGFALGWGKRVNGRLKNHYPRGLRR